MPLVFVHGVATRLTPEHQAAVRQRDALFRRLVLPAGDVIFDPDWGSNGVRFFQGGWVPKPGATEPLAVGTPAGGSSIASAVASRHVEEGVDLAIAALLAQRARERRELTEADLSAFESAVRYLEVGGDRTAFGPAETDAQFAQTLREELGTAPGQAKVEGMGLGDVFDAIGDAVRRVTDPIRNAGSDAVLRVVREPVSNLVALFLGDIFVYLRHREEDGAQGTYNRIFGPIIGDLARAASARRDGTRLVVVGHSLGAVVLYDLLTDARALRAVRDAAGVDLLIDSLVTVGAQPGLFADMGLYGNPDPGRLERPACVADWINVFDYTDVLSFRCEPFFEGVRDYAFDNVSGALDAHTAYFQRPSFYARLKTHLDVPATS